MASLFGKKFAVSVPADTRSVALLLALTVVTLVAYRASFAGFVDVWLNRGFYSHGFLIAGVGVFLLWRASRESLPESFSVSLLFVVPLSAISAAWFIARLVNVQVIELFLMPALLACWVMALVGFRSARRYLFPIVFLYFAVPFWDFFNGAAQQLTVIVVEWMLGFVKIPAFIEGNMVTIPEGRFEIAAGCSGLHYSLVMLTLTVLYGHLSYRTLLPKVIVTVAGLGLALFTNWIRVLVIIMVGHQSKMQHALISNHDNFGWMIFGVALIPFFIFAGRLPDNVKGAASQGGRLQTAPPESHASKSSQAAFAGAASLILIATLVGPALEMFAGRDLNKSEMVSSWNLASNFHQWERDLRGGQSWQPEFSGSSISDFGRYSNGQAVVDLNIFVYFSESQGKELISDSNRIAGPEEWRELKSGAVSWPGSDSADRTLSRIVVSNGKITREIWSYYEIGGYRATSPYFVKLLQVASALRHRRGNALIAVSMDCIRPCSEPSRHIAEFLEAASPGLSDSLSLLDESQ